MEIWCSVRAQVGLKRTRGGVIGGDQRRSARMSCSRTNTVELPVAGKRQPRHQTSSLFASFLTTWALVSGSSSCGRCCRRRRHHCCGRASCCGSTGSIFLLISAAVGAFAFLPLVVLLVGHFKTDSECQCLFSTSNSSVCLCCCQHWQIILWTPFVSYLLWLFWVALLFFFRFSQFFCCCFFFFSWTAGCFRCAAVTAALSFQRIESALTLKSEGVSGACFDSCSAVFFHPLTSHAPAPSHGLSEMYVAFMVWGKGQTLLVNQLL